MLRINSHPPTTLSSEEPSSQESELTLPKLITLNGSGLTWITPQIGSCLNTGEGRRTIKVCNQSSRWWEINHCSRIFETEPPAALVWLWSCLRMLGSKLAGPRLLALELPACRTKPINYIPGGALLLLLLLLLLRVQQFRALNSNWFVTHVVSDKSGSRTRLV